MISLAIIDRFDEIVPKTSDKKIIREFVSKMKNNSKDISDLKEYINHMFYQDYLKVPWLEELNSISHERD